MDTDKDYYKVSESPRQLPPLQPAPVLRNIAKVSPKSYVPPAIVDKLDDSSKLSARDIKEIHGIDLSDSEM